MLTLKTINRKLQEKGIAERLAHNVYDRYYYFTEGNTHKWPRTIVGGVYRLNQLTIDQWMNAYFELAEM